MFSMRPADYRDDATFMQLFFHAPGAELVQKHKGDVVDALDIKEPPAPEKVETEPGGSEKPAGQPVGKTSAQDGSCVPGEEWISQNNHLARILLAQELAIARLGRDLQLNFMSNARLKAAPMLEIDAVAFAPGRTIVAEITYTQRGHVETSKLNKLFQRAHTLYMALPGEVRRGFQFALVIVVDRLGGDQIKENSVRERVAQVAAVYPFSTKVEIYSLSELEKDPG